MNHRPNRTRRIARVRIDQLGDVGVENRPKRLGRGAAHSDGDGDGDGDVDAGFVHLFNKSLDGPVFERSIRGQVKPNSGGGHRIRVRIATLVDVQVAEALERRPDAKVDNHEHGPFSYGCVNSQHAVLRLQVVSSEL